MNSPTVRLQDALQHLRAARMTQVCGRVVQLIGLVIESEGSLTSAATRNLLAHQVLKGAVYEERPENSEIYRAG